MFRYYMFSIPVSFMWGLKEANERTTLSFKVFSLENCHNLFAYL